MRQNVPKRIVPRSRRGLFRFALRTTKGATDTASARHCHNQSSHRIPRTDPPEIPFSRTARPEHEPAAILESATRCLTLSPAAPPRSYRHKAALSPTLANELLGILHPYRIFVLLYGGVQDLRVPKPTSAKAIAPLFHKCRHLLRRDEDIESHHAFRLRQSRRVAPSFLRPFASSPPRGFTRQHRHLI